MGYTVPTTEPKALRAGDTWQWTRALHDFPAPTWILTYHFRNAASFFDIVAVADGDQHAIDVAMATTADFAVGRYNWTAVVTDNNARHEVDSGLFEVLPNVATAAPYDGRTWARQVLDAVEAALLGRATQNQIDLITATAGDRTVAYRPDSLIQLRSQLINEVRREEGATGGKLSRILVQFR